MALEVTIHKLTSWYDDRTLWEGEATDVRDALQKAVATDANLEDANLEDANLTDANLRGANLRGANLWGANLTGANLTDANLTDANLGGANLTDANLTDANLTDANLGGANLTDANLGGANLRGANLGGANLGGAKNLRLPTGETWEEYLTETVPALLTAGGKSLDSFGPHFVCHSWENCPMAHAFDVHRLEDIPLLLRPRADQFIQFFDAKQIPWPLPTKADLAPPEPGGGSRRGRGVLAGLWQWGGGVSPHAARERTTDREAAGD